MADEESAGGIEAVIKVTLDDSGIESEAQAAVEKAQSATKGKRAKVKVEVQVDPAQIEEAITKGTKSKKTVVKVKPVVDDGDIAALKATFNKASDSLVAARSALVNPGTDREEKRYLKAAIPSLEKLVADIPKEIAAKEGRRAPAPSSPVTRERTTEVAREIQAAMRGRPVERPASSQQQTSPVVVVRTTGTSSSQPIRTGRTVRTGAGPGSIAHLIRQLAPSLQGAGPIEALDSYYAAQDAAQAAEQRERERVVPLSRLARETARVPMERTTRRRAGRTTTQVPYHLTKTASKRADTVVTDDPTAFMATVAGRSECSRVI